MRELLKEFAQLQPEWFRLGIAFAAGFLLLVVIEIIFGVLAWARRKARGLPPRVEDLERKIGYLKREVTTPTWPSRRMRPSRASSSHQSRAASSRCPRSADFTIATFAARRSCGYPHLAVASRASVMNLGTRHLMPPADAWRGHVQEGL